MGLYARGLIYWHKIRCLLLWPSLERWDYFWGVLFFEGVGGGLVGAILWVYNKTQLLFFSKLSLIKDYNLIKVWAEISFTYFFPPSQAFSEKLLLKLHWKKLKIYKSSKLVKVDNKLIIVLIFINVYLSISSSSWSSLQSTTSSSGLLSHVLRLHLSLHLTPFTIYTHLSSIHRRLKSHDNKLNKAFDAGKPFIQIHDTNPFYYFHPLSSRSGISSDCCRNFHQRVFLLNDQNYHRPLILVDVVIFLQLPNLSLLQSSE